MGEPEEEESITALPDAEAMGGRALKSVCSKTEIEFLQSLQEHCNYA